MGLRYITRDEGDVNPFYRTRLLASKPLDPVIHGLCTHSSTNIQRKTNVVSSLWLKSTAAYTEVVTQIPNQVIRTDIITNWSWIVHYWTHCHFKFLDTTFVFLCMLNFYTSSPHREQLSQTHMVPLKYAAYTVRLYCTQLSFMYTKLVLHMVNSCYTRLPHRPTLC